jgi:hypothetical protein
MTMSGWAVAVAAVDYSPLLREEGEGRGPWSLARTPNRNRSGSIER